MHINNDRLASAARQPLAQIPDTHAKTFSAAKATADRSTQGTVANNGPSSRGPLEGGAAGAPSSPKAVTKPAFDSVKDKAKGDLDSMSEMGEMESLRLQMAMDRMSKMMSTLSNLLKKVSDTSDAITANIK